jgi:hypothetical protein
MVNLQPKDGITYIRATDALDNAKWMTEKYVRDYETIIPVKFYAGEIWCRFSGQIYLGLEDFEWAAYILKRCAKGFRRESSNDSGLVRRKGVPILLLHRDRSCNLGSAIASL